ncbi:hypothetical protein D3C81_519890 [compost metagenome]
MFLQITWSNGVQTNFNVYRQVKGELQRVAVLTQHGDLYCYVKTEDQKVEESKGILEAMEKLQNKLREEGIEEVKKLLKAGEKIKAIGKYKHEVYPGLSLYEAKMRVENLAQE